jgi:hypothetical protein
LFHDVIALRTFKGPDFGIALGARLNAGEHHPAAFAFRALGPFNWKYRRIGSPGHVMPPSAGAAMMEQLKSCSGRLSIQKKAIPLLKGPVPEKYRPYCKENIS